MKNSEISVDYRALVSRADIAYFSPTTESAEGLPIGNGRMGTLIWTANNSLNMQINRVDVFAQNSYSESGTDYCGGCGKIEVDFGEPVFKPAKNFEEYLSVYEGLLTISGDLVKAEAFAWNEEDVIVVRINDERKNPLPININLRMLRPAANRKTRYHKANSTFCQRDDKIILLQEFSEKEFFCSSVVEIGVVGRRTAVRKNRETIFLTVEPGSEPFTILISTFQSFDRNKDIISEAMSKLEAAGKLGFEEMLSETRAWWKSFWEKSFLHLHSSDGVADFVERCYTYHLYLMASSSRGKFPPKFNGMLWTTNGDEREWGAQYWLWNEEAMYYPLFAANHLELTDPYFDMYSGMLDNAKVAARQRWKSKGIFIPETVAFDGPEVLPEEIAGIFRAVLLGKLSYDKMPEKFCIFGNSKSGFSHIGNIFLSEQQWAWISHIVSGAAELGLQYWQRYQLTGDTEWLRNRAYPMIKGAVEFYRNFPKMKKEEDGFYHLYNTNVHETFWGVKDSIFDLAAIRGAIPLAIRASEILGVDEDLRPKWRELLEKLAPYPLNEEEGSAFGLGPGTWAACRKPTATGKMNVEQVWLAPVLFEDWTLETEDEIMSRTAQLTYENLPARKMLLEGVRVAGWSRIAVFSSRMGREDDLEILLPTFLATTLNGCPNALFRGEGVQAMCPENLGLASYALQEALLQSLPPKPGEVPVIRLYPAWPKSWDAQFSLLARGGFMVTSEFKRGKVQFVGIKSLLGEECLLRNSWPGSAVDIYRNGRYSEELSGELLEFSTVKNEEIIIVPKGKNITDLKVRVAPSRGTGIWELKHRIADKELNIIVGKR
ncbi:glycoside hydrolase [Candidatus Aerophobetes bacterium]|uniref:Glycoside hydrolase n=1 Tax=Aerophobetes bacterium TaxID=2030807 RepID=A0A497E3J1_UNCAE|nr:MAG: glycoside hydrolase [Candidatus Aerophobetes bacterium]